MKAIKKRQEVIMSSFGLNHLTLAHSSWKNKRRFTAKVNYRFVV